MSPFTRSLPEFQKSFAPQAPETTSAPDDCDGDTPSSQSDDAAAVAHVTEEAASENNDLPDGPEATVAQEDKKGSNPSAPSTDSFPGKFTEGQRPAALKHAYLHEYYSYHGAKQRAGKSGIKFGFQSLADLLNHLGPISQAGDTLDRVDPKDGYTRGNVRWASKALQRTNQTKMHIHQAFGVEGSVKEFAETLGISRSTLSDRVNKQCLTMEEVILKYHPERVAELVDPDSFPINNEQQFSDLWCRVYQEVFGHPYFLGTSSRALRDLYQQLDHRKVHLPAFVRIILTYWGPLVRQTEKANIWPPLPHLPAPKPLFDNLNYAFVMYKEVLGRRKRWISDCEVSLREIYAGEIFNLGDDAFIDVLRAFMYSREWGLADDRGHRLVTYLDQRLAPKIEALAGQLSEVPEDYWIELEEFAERLYN